MNIKKTLKLVFTLFLLNFGFLFSLEPSEILENEELENRAREISKIIRCVVCQNENIDSSDAEIATDLRVLIREKILAGESDDSIKEYIADRYGDFVLLLPRKSGLNLILWLFPPLLLFISLFFTLRFIFKKSNFKNKDINQ
tara:strand:- start:511 stop:936 length:426 start_codon:yes stop_codon:yes gene_type:complete